MPTRPPPIAYKCEACGWSKSYAPHSDALLEEPPDVCPKCGKGNLADESFTGEVDSKQGGFGESKLIKGLKKLLSLK